MNSRVLSEDNIDTIIDVLWECHRVLDAEPDLQDGIVESLEILGDYSHSRTTDDEEDDETEVADRP